MKGFYCLDRAGGEEAGGNPIPGDDAREAVRVATVSDVRLDARVHREFYCRELGRHAAHRKAASVFAHMAEDVVDIGHFRDEFIRFGLEQAVHAGEQDQALGSGEFRDARGKHVVVAKFQLLHGHGVVLVDDRENARLGEKSAERGGYIRRALWRAEVCRCQKHLRGGDFKVRKKTAVSLHQPRLTDGGACLARGRVLRVGVEPEGGDAGTDRTRGNKQAALSGIDKSGDGRNEMHKCGAVQRAIGGFSEHAGAGLDDGEIVNHRKVRRVARHGIRGNAATRHPKFNRLRAAKSRLPLDYRVASFRAR